MCGIAGIVSRNDINSSVSPEILKKMSDIIQHRGPDSDGMWMSEDRLCGLAFRRLSIIDLSSAGNQPMVSSDGKYTIVFNGEIYNHREIRNELENLGYKYHSKTDTETILNGYKQWGSAIVHKLSGMFSFAIWDSNKQELFAARDRVGKKPFYYSHQDGHFVFGSEIKSILLHPNVKKEFNQNELPNYLNWCMSSRRESLFKGIKKLAAGCFLHLTANGDLKIERYWSPISAFNGYNDLNEIELQSEILRILRLSIKDRMMSDVPFGVFLSGGIDSSLNVALMAELMDRPIDTFTVGFEELEKYNELKYARIISDRYHTNHHEILINERDSFSVLQDLTWFEDEPNGDPVCIPLFFLSKLTRDSGTTVVQVGEGSDELFVGYPWMMREYNFYHSYWKWFVSLPQSIRISAYKLSSPLLKSMGKFGQLDYIRRAAFGNEHYWAGMPIFPPVQQELLLKNRFHNLLSITPDYVSELHQEALKQKPDMDYLQRIFYVELAQRLSEILLMRVDKIGMAHSIEARVPFLDHRLIEFVMSIPPDKKIPDKKTTKYLLKKAVEPILPKEIINRPKQGFWAPVNEWMKGQWYDYALNNVNTSPLINEYFNTEYITQLFKNHKSGKQNNGLKLFQLLELSLWYDRFFR
jgi:asparagine synthase (glutamine-hydrolysing)